MAATPPKHPASSIEDQLRAMVQLLSAVTRTNHDLHACIKQLDRRMFIVEDYMQRLLEALTDEHTEPPCSRRHLDEDDAQMQPWLQDPNSLLVSREYNHP